MTVCTSHESHPRAPELRRTHHRPCQPSCHQRESQEENQSRLPRNAVPGVAERIRTQSRLVDRIDDKHAQGGADGGYPIDKVDVDL